jgi:formamidopyrimidine-DNA glycosylase
VVDLLADAAVGGGVVGIAGSIINKGLGYFTDKQKAKDALEAKKVDYEQAKELAKLGIETAQAQSQIDQVAKEIEGSFAGLQATVADQTVLSGKVDGWATDVLALFRPGITLLLVATMATLAVVEHEPIAKAVASMTGMALAWWFGDRQAKK